MSASIPENIIKLRNDIAAAEQKYARELNSVQLLAVSKTHSAESIRIAFDSGLNQFGENYLQEALEKQKQLSDLDIEWHFIGPIQSNKTRSIAEHFSWVHSIDRLKIALRLGEQRPASLSPLKVLLQVKIGGEESKSGFAINELSEAAKQIAAFPNLTLAGLMTIPAPSDNVEKQRENFRLLAEARDSLQKLGYSEFKELYMGMSQDFEAAIAEGSTLIRIGTGIFGPRS